MNILVTGACGQLGSEMRNLAAESPNRFIFSDVIPAPGEEVVPLDITNLGALRIVCDSEKVDVIVNCAGYTAVDKAEDEPAMAELLNSTAVSYLAQVAAERDAVLIHISTDYVFRGDVPVPCTEDTPASPSGVYGSTKYAGERAALQAGCRCLIFRTAWLYSPYGRNFVKTILRLCAERPSIKVVADQVGTPTYAHDLAALIVGVIDSGRLDRTGVYHYSNEGAVSWYDFAKAIGELSGSACDIRPCRTGEYPSKAPRPAYSVLDKTKVKETFGVEVPYWRDSLKDCLRRLDVNI